MSQVTTTTNPDATGYSNQRKVARCSNGVLWASWNRGVGAVALPTETTFWYSEDNGATWTYDSNISHAGSSTNYTPNHSFFIDEDDYAHVAYKDMFDGYIYYRRGTPNAERTAWTWSGAEVLYWGTNAANYPDVIAHREGTGWAAHIVFSNPTSGQAYVSYRRVDIASDGSLFNVNGTSATNPVNGNAVATSNHTMPSIDFHHTGDGKTVAGGVPHLFVAWSSGATGAGNGIRSRKGVYSTGSWTWGTEQEISSAYYMFNTYQWLNCLFDGTRVIIGGNPSNGSSNDLVLWERDEADTATVEHLIVDGSANNWARGSFTYDVAGNVYFVMNEYVANHSVSWRKWTRDTGVLGEPTLIDSNIQGGSPHASAKRGFSNDSIEFVYTGGSADPYSVMFGSIDVSAPVSPHKMWDGTAFVTAVAKVWDGTAWA